MYDNKIDLTLNVSEGKKFSINRINIYGNNITQENVIRNQLLIDEGDEFNSILTAKSINNIKSLRIFEDVKSKIIDNDDMGFVAPLDFNSDSEIPRARDKERRESLNI